MPHRFDVAIVGAGPAGSTCAAFCAEAGLSTALLDRAEFPRDKVCGDCLNPACWEILGQLQVVEAVHELPHARLTSVDFVDLKNRQFSVPLPQGRRGEIAVKRSHLDHLLLENARKRGATICTAETVTGVAEGWRITTSTREIVATYLVAADGRNSTVARQLGVLPAAARDRIAFQSHVPLPPDLAGRVVLQLRPEGYCGCADVGDDHLNVCLVSTSQRIEKMREWACARFGLDDSDSWRSIAPLARAAVHSKHRNLLLVGDAARVVEPFTGEGIYYALATGRLAARHIAAARASRAPVDTGTYWREHRRIYRGRLWLNQLVRTAVMHPTIGNAIIRAGRAFPPLLPFLTAKVVR